MPKHRKILLQACCLFLMLFCIAIFCLQLTIYAIISCTAVIIAGGLLLLLLNKKLKKQLNNNIYPDNDWYRIHLERNYDTLILGSDGYQKATAVHSTKVFDLSLQGQTLKWDYMILKQYFSILKPQGEVIFVIKTQDLWKGWNDVKDKRPYYMCMRPYVFTNNSIMQLYIKIARRLPVIMFRLPDLWRKSRTLEGLNEDKEKTFSLLRDISSFCVQRDILPYIKIVGGCDKDTEDAILTTGVKVIINR